MSIYLLYLAAGDLETAEDKFEKAKRELEETVAELTDIGV